MTSRVARRVIIHIITVLVVLFGVSVGFSSWVVGGTLPTTMDANIGADYVLGVMEGVTVSLRHGLVFGHYFFLTESGSYDSTDALSFTIEMNGSDINAATIVDGRLAFYGTLKSAGNFAIFEENIFLEARAGGSTLGFEASADNKSISFSFSALAPATGSNASLELDFVFSNDLINRYGDSIIGTNFVLEMGSY